MATFVYGLFNKKGECLYIGQTAQPRARFEAHKCKRFRTVPCIMRVLRECPDVENGNRIEVQIMKSYRKRGQAAMNRVLKASGNFESAQPDKLLNPAISLSAAEKKELISEAMQILGSQTSARKKRTSAANLRKTNTKHEH